MKKPHRIPCSCVVLLILAAVVPSAVLEADQTADADLSVIATNAFSVLRDVPTVGLEKSVFGIEMIIETHRHLLREANLAQRQLSLVLADAVAYAIVTEIHRSDVSRLGTDPNITPQSIPFDKKTAVRLWRANVPDFPAAIRQALRGNDTVTGYVSTQSSEKEVLSGDMIDKAPLDTIQLRLQELRGKAFQPRAFGVHPSADEQLVYALDRYQAFRDLAVIICLYENSELPTDSASLRTAIGGIMKPSAGKRVDDGY